MVSPLVSARSVNPLDFRLFRAAHTSLFHTAGRIFRNMQSLSHRPLQPLPTHRPFLRAVSKPKAIHPMINSASSWRILRGPGKCFLKYFSNFSNYGTGKTPRQFSALPTPSVVPPLENEDSFSSAKEYKNRLRDLYHKKKFQEIIDNVNLTLLASLSPEEKRICLECIVVSYITLHSVAWWFEPGDEEVKKGLCEALNGLSPERFYKEDFLPIVEEFRKNSSRQIFYQYFYTFGLYFITRETNIEGQNFISFLKILDTIGDLVPKDHFVGFLEDIEFLFFAGNRPALADSVLEMALPLFKERNEKAKMYEELGSRLFALLKKRGEVDPVAYQSCVRCFMDAASLSEGNGAPFRTLLQAAEASSYTKNHEETKKLFMQAIGAASNSDESYLSHKLFGEYFLHEEEWTSACKHLDTARNTMPKEQKDEEQTQQMHKDLARAYASIDRKKSIAYLQAAISQETSPSEKIALFGQLANNYLKEEEVLPAREALVTMLRYVKEAKENEAVALRHFLEYAKVFVERNQSDSLRAFFLQLQSQQQGNDIAPFWGFFGMGLLELSSGGYKEASQAFLKCRQSLRNREMLTLQELAREGYRMATERANPQDTVNENSLSLAFLTNQRVEEKRIDSFGPRFPIEGFASHHDCAILANEIYSFAKKVESHEEEYSGFMFRPRLSEVYAPSLPQWRYVAHIGGTPKEEKDHGYLGVAYYNEETKTLLCVHRGTQVPENWKTNQGIPFGSKNVAFSLAAHLRSEALAHLEKEGIFPKGVMHTGHSLGGSMANEVAFKENNPATSFETPGENKLVQPGQDERVEKIDYSRGNYKEIITFLTEPNVLDTTQGHSPEPYRLFTLAEESNRENEQERQTDRVQNSPSLFSLSSVLDFFIRKAEKSTNLPIGSTKKDFEELAAKTPERHKMESIKETFAEQEKNSRPIKISKVDAWPTEFPTDILSYQSNKKAFNEKNSDQDWHGKTDTLFHENARYKCTPQNYYEVDMERDLTPEAKEFIQRYQQGFDPEYGSVAYWAMEPSNRLHVDRRILNCAAISLAKNTISMKCGLSGPEMRQYLNHMVRIAKEEKKRV